MRNRLLTFATLSLFLAACGSESESSSPVDPDSQPEPGADPTAPPTDTAEPPIESAENEEEPLQPGLHRVDDQMIFQTAEFTVPPQGELYSCWATPVPESFKISSYEYSGRPVVHHALFYGVAAADEPEEFVECADVTFKASWMPLFGSGAGQTNLDFPDGVAQSVAEGSQLLVQLHLLNASSESITDSATLVMNRTENTDTEPLQMGVIGNFDVNLPPQQPSQVVAECDIQSDVRMVGLWPHMHYLGTSLTLEVGPTTDSMSTFYERNPYEFDQQTIDGMDTVIEGGQHARVTCHYLNDRAETVTYGESSNNEMCFLLTFTAGGGMGPCLSGAIPPSLLDQLNP